MKHKFCHPSFVLPWGHEFLLPPAEDLSPAIQLAPCTSPVLSTLSPILTFTWDKAFLVHPLSLNRGSCLHLVGFLLEIPLLLASFLAVVPARPPLLGVQQSQGGMRAGSLLQHLKAEAVLGAVWSWDPRAQPLGPQRTTPEPHRAAPQRSLSCSSSVPQHLWVSSPSPSSPCRCSQRAAPRSRPEGAADPHGPSADGPSPPAPSPPHAARPPFSPRPLSRRGPARHFPSPPAQARRGQPGAGSGFAGGTSRAGPRRSQDGGGPGALRRERGARSRPVPPGAAMLRSSGYFRGIDCPFLGSGGSGPAGGPPCRRPYCHFRHPPVAARCGAPGAAAATAALGHGAGTAPAPSPHPFCRPGASPGLPATKLRRPGGRGSPRGRSVCGEKPGVGGSREAR